MRGPRIKPGPRRTTRPAGPARWQPAHWDRRSPPGPGAL